jgi:hypothetical protein
LRLTQCEREAALPRNPTRGNLARGGAETRRTTLIPPCLHVTILLKRAAVARLNSDNYTVQVPGLGGVTGAILAEIHKLP